VKRKFALLTVLGALLALAIPASSFGAFSPAGYKFEIPGTRNNSPTLGTSLGSCATNITGQIPGTETPEGFPVVLAAGTCNSGTTLAFNGEWRMSAVGTQVVKIWSTSGGLTMKFSSLPGCKLTGTAATLYGEWLTNQFLADGGTQLTWAAEGGSCALAGTHEWVDFRSLVTAGTTRVPDPSFVTDLTNPNIPITDK
jgi:hypothetical protein